MADKTIGTLPAAARLDDESLLVAEQQGEAVSVSGALFKQFAAAAATTEADRAKEAADRAAAAVAHNPMVGANGNWFVWDANTGSYVDSGHAATGAEVFVTSFKGRTGAIVPQSGDYTAAMVDAAPAGCTNNTNVYVSTSGNDATGNGTSTSPYATIQKAINSIPKNLGGYTIRIYIAPGTYEETVRIQSFISGTIALLNQETEKPKITGNIQVENNNCSVMLYSLDVTGNMSVVGNTHFHTESCAIISNTAVAINIVNNGEVFIRGSSVLATGSGNYKGAITVSMSLCSITASTIQEGTTLGLSSVNGGILYTTGITNNASTKTAFYQGKIYE